jgi:hypothetical protein
MRRRWKIRIRRPRGVLAFVGYVDDVELELEKQRAPVLVTTGRDFTALFGEIL